jgi:valyl-tRNA synthetase
LMIEAWPRVRARDGSDRPTQMDGPVRAVATLWSDPAVAAAREDMVRLMDVVTSARSLKAQFQISPAQPVPIVVRASDDAQAAALLRVQGDIVHLARLSQLEIVAPGGAVPQKCGTEVVRGLEVMLPLAGLVDIDAERSRLQKERDKIAKELGALQAKLQNPGFRDKAPPAVVAKERERLAGLQLDHEKLAGTLTRLAE